MAVHLLMAMDRPIHWQQESGRSFRVWNSMELSYFTGQSCVLEI